MSSTNSSTPTLDTISSDMTQRYPLTRTPDGWYCIVRSDELAAGEVKAVSCLNRELVVFRTESGQAAVLDAYCPHLGAHLGVGGCVEGENVVCPFHRWTYGTDGHCTSIPYAKKVPMRAQIRSYTVREKNGLVMIWLHHQMAEPWYEIPTFPREGWSKQLWGDLFLDAHIIEFADNGVDIAHFPPIHNSERGGATVYEKKGSCFRFQLRTGYPGEGIGVPGRRVLVDTEWWFHGLGIYYGEHTAQGFGTRLQHTFSFTPLPNNRTHVRIGVAADLTTVQPELIDMVVQKGLEISRNNLLEDAPIWANKRYVARPVLSEGDGPLGAMRLWIRQFFPELGAAQRGRAAQVEPVALATDGEWIDTRQRDEHDFHLPGSRDARPRTVANGSAHAGSNGTNGSAAHAGANGSAHASDEANGSSPKPAMPEVTRSAVQTSVLTGVPASFDAQAAGESSFVVQYDIEGEAGGTYHVQVAGGRCQAHEGAAGQADVRVAASDADWLAMQVGALDAAEAFMSQRLRVSGNMELAMKLGAIFRLPQSGA
jgi:phenylpropionate dioxygenase-like ring-hydroxylating dioxygenase large terminal subunit/putative sterol carrier protein